MKMRRGMKWAAFAAVVVAVIAVKARKSYAADELWNGDFDNNVTYPDNTYWKASGTVPTNVTETRFGRVTSPVQAGTGAFQGSWRNTDTSNSRTVSRILYQTYVAPGTGSVNAQLRAYSQTAYTGTVSAFNFTVTLRTGTTPGAGAVLATAINDTTIANDGSFLNGGTWTPATPLTLTGGQSYIVEIDWTATLAKYNGTTYSSFTVTVDSVDLSASPSGFTATPATGGAPGVNLSWTPSTPGMGAYTLSKYNLYRGTASGAEAAIAVASPLSSATSYADAGLVGNTIYYYQLTDYDSGSIESPRSAEVFAWTVPDAPASPTFTSVTTSGLTVNWAAPVGDPTTGLTYYVDRAPDSSGSAGTFAQVAGALGTITYADSGRSSCTKYWYRVHAQNGTGDGLTSTPVSVMTGGCTLAIGDGTNPSDPPTPVAPGGPTTALDAFTISIAGGSAAVSAVQFALASVSGPTPGANVLSVTVTCGASTGAVTASPSNAALASTVTATLSPTLTVNAGTPVNCTASVTPKTAIDMPPPAAGLAYALTGVVTGLTASTTVGVNLDTGSAIVTIDNLSPANPPSLGGIAASSQVTLNWTNPSDPDVAAVVVLRRPGGAVNDTPTEGQSYLKGASVGGGGSTVACVGSTSTTNCSDTLLTNGTAYYYKAFAADAYYNWSAGGTAAGPYTPYPVIDITDGTLVIPPTLAAVGPTATGQPGVGVDVDGFALTASTGTASVTAVQVTFAPGSGQYLKKAAVTCGLSVGSVTSSSTLADQVSVPLSPSLSVTAATQCKVTVTPAEHQYMPAVPGATYNVTVSVTGVTAAGYNTGILGDSGSATLPVDNLSPGAPVNAVATGGNTTATITWNAPADSDIKTLMVIRNTTAAADSPTEGTAYLLNGGLGSASTVRYYNAVSPNLAGTLSDTVLANGTPYTYRLFAADTFGNWSLAAQVTVTPHAPLNSVTPLTLTATAPTCNSVAVSSTFTDDSDNNSSTTIARGINPTGPFSVIPAGCSTSLIGPSPRGCTDTTVQGSQPDPQPAQVYYYQATYSDPGGVNAVLSPVRVQMPTCSNGRLTIAGTSAAANAIIGSWGNLAATLTLAANTQTVTLTSLGITNGQILQAASPGTDVYSLTLTDPSGSGNVLGESIWDGATYAFSGLSYTVSPGLPKTLNVYLNVANTAANNNKFLVNIASATVAVDVGNTVTIPGAMPNPITITNTGLKLPGTQAAGSTLPTVSIINPSASMTVAGKFRVQVRVYSPTKLTNLANGNNCLNGVAVSSDNGNNFPTQLTKSIVYPPGNNLSDPMYAWAGVYETTTSTHLNLPVGTYTLRACANNGTGVAYSGPVNIRVAPAGNGDGNLLVRDNSSQLCNDCHNLANHSSETTADFSTSVSKYGSWATTCRDCHDPHGTQNVMLFREQVTPPWIGTIAPRGPTQVYFSKRSGAGAGDSGVWAGSGNRPSASFVNNGGDGPCQVCHTRTNFGGVPRWQRNDAGGNAEASHFTVGGTQPCTDCHSHTAGFRARESAGGEDCDTCHGSIYLRMKKGGLGTHFHLLSSAQADSTKKQVYPASGSTVYPNAVPGGDTDSNRRCLMCHVDHNLFRNDTVFNTANGGRAKNLRTSITTSPTAAAGLAATDFDGLATPPGGICTSCHSSSLAKATPGGGTTLVVNPATFNASAHDYATNPTSTFRGNPTNTFSANCSKCHSDTLRKNYQSSAYPTKFSLHDSKLASISAPLGAWNYTGGGALPTDPFAPTASCLQCHKAGATLDFYGKAPMKASAIIVATQVTEAFSHKVGTYGASHLANETRAQLSATKHVECADCHSPHGAGGANHVPGTNAILAGNPGNPLSGATGAVPTFPAGNWVTPSGYSLTAATREGEVCMKCHSSFNTNLNTGGAAWNTTWTDVARDFNPANKSFHPVLAALNSPGSGSNVLGAGALNNGWTPGRTMYCSDCHGDDAATPAAQGPHGSAVKFMLKGPNTLWPLDGGGNVYKLIRGAPVTTGMFCKNCHTIYPYSNNVHSEHGGAQDTSNLPCVACHTLLPHGGKVSRLLITDTAITNGYSRYAYQGVNGQKGWNGLLLRGFLKTSSNGYSQSNCQAVSGNPYTGGSCSGDHPTFPPGGDAW